MTVESRLKDLWPEEPLGLRPRNIATKQRIQEILEAMLRYNSAHKKIASRVDD